MSPEQLRYELWHIAAKAVDDYPLGSFASLDDAKIRACFDRRAGVYDHVTAEWVVLPLSNTELSPPNSGSSDTSNGDVSDHAS